MSRPQAPRPLPTPLPNSYWVEPGRLLAGEYPGASTDGVQRLLRAGVNVFVDLTVDGELAPYQSLLPADGSVVHCRFAVTDHDVPRSPYDMQRILGALDAALAAGRCVYVHCRAGIGRTGTVIGCHLVRGGLAPNVALDRLNQLWQQNARSVQWPTVPETDAQHHYVLAWRESVVLDLAQRCEGALIGLICGEARSATGSVSGPDAAMTLCVLNSLRERGGHDAPDQMQRYLDWSRTVPATEVPTDFRRALAAWQWSKKPNAGSHDPKNLDAHSLARSLAAALFLHRDPGAAMELAADISRTTQQSPVVLDLCRLWTALLIDALNGAERRELLTLQRTPAMTLLRARRVRAEVEVLLESRWRQLAAAGDDAVSMCVRALRAFESADNFSAGLRALPSTHSAVQALYGSLAGAHFGVAAIAGREAVPDLQSLRTLARAFA